MNRLHFELINMRGKRSEIEPYDMVRSPVLSYMRELQQSCSPVVRTRITATHKELARCATLNVATKLGFLGRILHSGSSRLWAEELGRRIGERAEKTA